MRVGSALRHARPLLFLAPILLATLDTWLIHTDLTNDAVVASCLGLLALLVARRYPVTVFVCILPALFLGSSFLLPGIAAYNVGRYTERTPVALVCGGAWISALFIGVNPFDQQIDAKWFVSGVIFDIALAAAPILLGRLGASRISLHTRLIEITRAREEGNTLRTQTALAQDRAQLAREMHDVVSHHVSLIAVHAGALEMTTPDATAAEAGATIRELAVKTLDELRHMVTVLAASGTRAGLSPQPTVADLPELLSNSGLDVSSVGGLPGDLPVTAQRAIYRTIQEALTNVRKHAPGAQVTVELASNPSEVTVAVRNTSGTQPRLGLPSSGHGLRGLTERAELLDGTLTAHALSDGGFEVTLRLPA